MTNSVSETSTSRARVCSASAKKHHSCGYWTDAGVAVTSNLEYLDEL
jgi:hypothetical protein